MIKLVENCDPQSHEKHDCWNSKQIDQINHKIG